MIFNHKGRKGAIISDRISIIKRLYLNFYQDLYSSTNIVPADIRSTRDIDKTILQSPVTETESIKNAFIIKKGWNNCRSINTRTIKKFLQQPLLENTRRE